MKEIKVWKGYDGKVLLSLTQDSSVPQANSITRATFAFGDICLDTDHHSEIQLVNDNQAIELQLGLVEGIRTLSYVGYLTIFDAQAPNGLPWGDPVRITVNSWKSCEV